ncbi:MAG: hypothetical protein J6U25_02280 [Clostridia bacterium]|nr:hypothetical protein [Clostridia bacterium]
MTSELFRQSAAYKILSADKKAGRLSHAYIISSEDGDMLGYYLTEAAKMLVCGHIDGYCDSCRACRLIEKRCHVDVTFYPKDKKLTVADIDELIAQSIVRPLEADKRVFIVERLETLNQNQNKLLKTLEEPPKNVFILIGTQKESAILPTIKSRARKISIPVYTVDELLELTKNEFPDRKRAAISALISGGRAGKMKIAYESDEVLELFNTAASFLEEAKSAKDLPLWYGRFSAFDAQETIAVFKVLINEVLRIKCGNKSIIDDKRLIAAESAYPMGALVAICERLSVLEKGAYFNANKAMLFDSVLFALLEERAKWRRL